MLLLLGNTQKQRRARNECRGLCTLFVKLSACGSKRFDREPDLCTITVTTTTTTTTPTTEHTECGRVGGNGYHSGTRTDVVPGVVGGGSVAWALVVAYGGRTRARNSPRSRARSFRKEERSTERSGNLLAQKLSEPNLGEYFCKESFKMRKSICGKFFWDVICNKENQFK